ncbi:hypothetical protein UA08_00350 [Talaromyces atroroseus]|uniref:Conidiation-specific protein 10 n=1 Tax=Talaromyces atroroseus TaxID=1441469 RepID=A0A225BAR5_TALAT|nr:hypothetical protein UA08_00350 [Talaromyces atroroseus]OKL64005.1 hypothetical protein UA08_00350 [Talaromyces atroroseus]
MSSMPSGRQTYKHLGQYLLHCRKCYLGAEPTASWSLITPVRAPGSTGKRQFGTTPQPRRPQHPNPGNFVNRPKDELREIGKKGGQKGGRATGSGGFHDMDPVKQREIAAKGGHASTGSFTKGSKQARDAGRKGGRARKTSSPSREEYEDVFV